MLSAILRLFRPSYALTALVLFGGWQGYSFVKSVPERLNLPLGIKQGQTEQEAASAGIEQEQVEKLPSSPTVAAIQNVHPCMRIVYWLVGYILLCFSGVPVIKKALRRESNLTNAIVILIYVAVGFLSAFALAAFQFTWITAIMLVAALVFSAWLIIWLSSELEELRVQDTFSSS